jgi:hypothetical protein
MCVVHIVIEKKLKLMVLDSEQHMANLSATKWWQIGYRMWIRTSKRERTPLSGIVEPLIERLPTVVPVKTNDKN